MSEDDKRIVQLLIKDNEHALDEIFHLYFNRLFHFSLGFVKDREEAREIVHDAIFRLWQKRHQLDSETSVLGYLIIVVRNLSLNYLRQFRNRKRLSFSNTDLESELYLNYKVLSNPVWDHLLTEEINLVLDAALSSLTEKCRKVFELSRYEDLSNAEIADKLRISVKTVEGHITEALKQIRVHLSRYMTSVLLF